LAGLPVHVITANDYLAERDAVEMGLLYRSLGLSVGNPAQGMDPAQRRAVYRCHVVYCSNKDTAFDFLRDRIAIGRRSCRLSVSLERLANPDSDLNRLLLPGLCFAIVDEADSVLVDEARTPLIISASGDDGDPDGFYAQAVAVRVEQLRARGRPVLIGTRTVAASELARDALRRLGIPHRGARGQSGQV